MADRETESQNSGDRSGRWNSRVGRSDWVSIHLTEMRTLVVQARAGRLLCGLIYFHRLACLTECKVLQGPFF